MGKIKIEITTGPSLSHPLSICFKENDETTGGAYIKNLQELIDFLVKSDKDNQIPWYIKKSSKGFGV